MVCIYCGNKTKTINSRSSKSDNQTWRRKQCLACESVFTTYEGVSIQDALRVTKKDGSIEPFYRDKLFTSLYLSLEHLNQPIVKATQVTAGVLRLLFNNKPTPPNITSTEISAAAVKVLKNFNTAASIRYMSYQTQLATPKDIKQSLK